MPTGGKYYLSSESAEDAEESYNRARSSSQPSAYRRHNLSLNISSLPAPFQNVHLSSPTSLASSGAPYTDSFSLNNVHLGQDYFQFDEASLPSATESMHEPYFQQVSNHFGYRLPASQPSSPVRSIYPSGQGPSVFSAGRQRGATFSGSFSPHEEAVGGPLHTLSLGLLPASAVPTQLSFSNTRSPLDSPFTESPLITGSPVRLNGDQGYFGEIPPVTLNTDLDVTDVLMDDVSTPTPAMPASLDLHPSYQDTPMGSTTHDMSGEQLDKLSLLDA